MHNTSPVVAPESGHPRDSKPPEIIEPSSSDKNSKALLELEITREPEIWQHDTSMYVTTLLNPREGAMQEGKAFETQAASKKKKKKTGQVELPDEN